MQNSYLPIKLGAMTLASVRATVTAFTWVYFSACFISVVGCIFACVNICYFLVIRLHLCLFLKSFFFCQLFLNFQDSCVVCLQFQPCSQCLFGAVSFVSLYHTQIEILRLYHCFLYVFCLQLNYTMKARTEQPFLLLGSFFAVLMRQPIIAYFILLHNGSCIFRWGRNLPCR